MTPRLTRLGNGLAVASLSMPGVETAAVALSVDAGARHEQAAENGLAHLFEHMVFKGTASRTARGIAEAIENVGGNLNAWTSRDATCFHARTLSDDVPLAIELLADLVTNASFAEADFELERQVVLSEIGEALETPDDLVFDHLQEVAFPDQSLGRAVLGSVASLAALDTGALRHWRQQQYGGAALVLAAAGRVEHDQIVRQAERLLGGIRPGSAGKAEAARWGGGARTERQPREQLHVALGYQGFPPTDRRQNAARIFAMALGGGMSSRLFQQLREERGLAYSVSAGHNAHADTGMLFLYAATRPEDGAAALALLRSVAAETARNLAPAEFERARAQLKSGVLMALEGCAAQADWLGGSLLTYGRIVSPQELVAELDAVTLDEARDIATAMLASAEALAMVGPDADAQAR